jgi:hypothetical protein
MELPVATLEYRSVAVHEEVHIEYDLPDGGFNKWRLHFSEFAVK